MKADKATGLLMALLALGSLAAACGGDEGEARAASTPSISCEPYFRAQLTDQPRAGDRIDLPATGGDETVTVGDFRFRVLYVVDEFETPSVDVFVETAEGSTPITQHKLQFGEGGPGASFAGGHGFTGLSYVRHPESRSELQYTCAES